MGATQIERHIDSYSDYSTQSCNTSMPSYHHVIVVDDLICVFFNLK